MRDWRRVNGSQMVVQRVVVDQVHCPPPPPMNGPLWSDFRSRHWSQKSLHVDPLLGFDDDDGEDEDGVP